MGLRAGRHDGIPVLAERLRGANARADRRPGPWSRLSEARKAVNPVEIRHVALGRRVEGSGCALESCKEAGESEERLAERISMAPWEILRDDLVTLLEGCKAT